jgi:Domain of unknown function (DUF1905)/Bacteriocin-protection, YdeI or OmpD-Associated
VKSDIEPTESLAQRGSNAASQRGMPPSTFLGAAELHWSAQASLAGGGAMKKLTFKVKLDGVPGMEAAALSTPFDVESTFGTRARVPVRGTINGFPYRSSLMPMDGCHRMVVNREIREGAGVKAGDTVKVVMERDDAPRTVAPPPQLKKELAKNKTAQANWEKLSYTHKKEMARSIVEVKQEETRVRRLAKVMGALKNGKKWMG